ncbi:hypothetical protein E3N88_08004 [Mikania micrantha]|uniref:Pentatricopeptide repeat-containing protein n=1 Tax=Mikania micrantha TaxID=192012 RepID=A0A5N6PF08_9ASTR|nr:hypothetical protein E3N88_08004 [Mikania micrantha]
MPKQDVSNNTLIMGYAQNNMYNEAMIMLREMGNAKMKPHAYTLSSVLPIVAEYMDFWNGKEIHGYGIRHGFERNGFITSGLTNHDQNWGKKKMNKKEVACSWIRIGEKVHAFVTGDESHSSYACIINTLNILFGQIKKEVYVMGHQCIGFAYPDFII